MTIPTFVILVSCAGSAPPLPVDTTASNKQNSISIADFTSSDAAMDCNAIQAEQNANATKIDLDNQAIKSNRQQNEVAGFMGGIFFVPWAATESNSDEKDDIAKLQQRQDVLIKLVAAKKCQI